MSAYLGPDRRKGQRRLAGDWGVQSTDGRRYWETGGTERRAAERRQEATAQICSGLSAEGMLALKEVFEFLAEKEAKRA